MQIFEAFRALNALNEDIFSLDADGAEKLSNFMQNDDLEDNVQIIDPEAETEDDLQDNYIGKVILDCCVCHSKIYKEKSEVDVDETGELANVGEECPYCFTPDGFKVIGEVVAFGDDSSEEDVEESEITEVEDTEEATIDSTDTDDVIEEAFTLTETDNLSGFLNNYSDKIVAIVKKIWPKNLTAAQGTEIKNNLRALQGSAEGNKLDKVYKGVTQKDSEPEVEKPSVRESFSKEEELNESIKTKFVLEFDNMNGSGTGWLKIPTNLDEIDEHDSDSWFTRNKKEATVFTSIEDAEHAYNEYVIGYPLIGADAFDTWTFEDVLATIDGSLNEGIEDLSMTANGTHVDVSEEENGKVTVTMEPVTADGGETIAPVSPEAEAEIMADEEIETSTEEPSDELGFDEPTGEGSEVNADFDEFDENSMDGLGESYFRKVYENVKSFKTTGVKTRDNCMIIEGLLEFDSGNKKNTSFIFEALDATKSGKFRFVGDNKELTEGKKAFMLTGTIKNNKLMVESMNYNYKHIDAEGKSSRVYGTERLNKGE